MAGGKPACQTVMVNESDYDIIGRFGSIYRGFVQYYLLAGNAYRLDRLRWVMETSMLKTLAAKHRSTVSKMAARYKATISTPQGPRTCFQASIQRNGKKPLVARFGGISLKRQPTAVITDRLPAGPTYPTRELVKSLRKGRCELCKHAGEVQVHHVKALADLDQPGKPQPHWAQVMAKRHRKSLVVCAGCHDQIHGASQPTARGQITGEPDDRETVMSGSAGGHAEKDQQR